MAAPATVQATAARPETGPRIEAMRRAAADFEAVFLGQPLANVATVLHAAGEDQHGMSVTGDLGDLGTGRFDDCRIIHRRFDFVRDELTGADMQLARGRSSWAAGRRVA